MHPRKAATLMLAVLVLGQPGRASAAEETPDAGRHFSPDHSRRLLYEFDIRQNGAPMSDQVFLARIAAVDPAFSRDKLQAYWPGNVATLGAGAGLALAALGGLALFVGGTNTTFEVAQGGVYQTKPVEMPLAGWSAALQSVGAVALYGGGALTVASAPAIVWFNYLRPPERQFNLLEAKRAAAKYNARSETRSPIEVSRPAVY